MQINWRIQILIVFSIGIGAGVLAVAGILPPVFGIAGAYLFSISLMILCFDVDKEELG